MTGPMRVPECCATGDTHCITCSDEGTPMRVLSVDAGSGLALCAPEALDAAPAEVMTELVGGVVPGDVLLVHAGTALLRLSAEREATA